MGFWVAITRKGSGSAKVLSPMVTWCSCLEQRALHLGGSAVYLIGQHEIGKHGAFLHLEVLVFLRVDHGAHHIGGKQVGGELYAAVLGIDKLGQGLDGQGLGQSGHAFQKDVPVAEQSYQE